MATCDTNRSGLITYSEAIACGGSQFWSMVKPFDSNRDNMLSRSEIYAAVQYYHTNNWKTLNEITDGKKEEVADVDFSEVKTFMTANVFAGLESFISSKTRS